MYKIGIITASDKGAVGERIDKSGPLIRETMESLGYRVGEIRIVPDERRILSETMIEFSKDYDLILTTGGTGFSPRDWTPEATRDVIDRDAPGIAEAMRLHSLKITPKAVRENLECLIPALGHGLEVLTGKGGECGSE